MRGQEGTGPPLSGRLLPVPALQSAPVEDVDVWTEGYGAWSVQSGETSVGDCPDGTEPERLHVVIPASRLGKQACRRVNQIKKQRAEGPEGESSSAVRARPPPMEAAKIAAAPLKEWTIRNGWVQQSGKRGREDLRPRPAACWLVALNGMARGMLSLWDIWVGMVKEVAFSGRSVGECLTLPIAAGQGVMGLVVVSALWYRYAQWAFRHLADFRVSE